MQTIENEHLRLAVGDDGRGLQLIDLARRCVWRLDDARCGYRPVEEAEGLAPFTHSHARREDEAIRISHQTPQGPVDFVWRLEADHVRVTLQTRVRGLTSIALPGSFQPAEGRLRLALPLYQGLLIDRGRAAWQARLGHHGHFGLNMAMAGFIAERSDGPHAGLLVAHDSASNWRGAFGQGGGSSGDGLFFHYEHARCPVDGWIEAGVCLYPTDGDVTSLCKRYRRRLVDRGQFTRWDEKITAKPIVSKLFGAVFAFIGYNHSDEIDYVQSLRKLKARGFESIFVFPARFCHYSTDFRMGGDAPIHLSDEQIEAMRAIEGVYLSPWGWVNEALDDGTPQRRRLYRQEPAGQCKPGWKIDDYQWYQTCTPYQVEHVRDRLAGDMRPMDWIHFDVSAMYHGMCCMNPEHELHGGGPLSRRDDVIWTRRLFSPHTVGNRVVSSEGFADHYAAFYDVGTTKVVPSYDHAGPGPGPAIVVPMTSLVFRDSCIHDWWELHNYNANPGFGLGPTPHGLARNGAGEPRLKAAIDALHGFPPSLFPFGRQYAWVNIQTRQTYSFLIRLEDAEVQEAIEAALPVARLHGRLGRRQMLAFEMLSDDGLLQASTFSDGTRVVANLGPTAREVPGLGLLEGPGWRVAQEPTEGSARPS